MIVQEHKCTKIITFDISYDRFQFTESISPLGLNIDLDVLDNNNKLNIISLCGFHTVTREDNSIYMHRNNLCLCVKLNLNINKADEFYLLIQKCINLYDPEENKKYSDSLTRGDIVRSNFVSGLLKQGQAGNESNFQIGSMKPRNDGNMDIDIAEILERREKNNIDI